MPVVRDQDGRPEVFARGQDTRLRHSRQRPEGGWSQWPRTLVWLADIAGCRRQQAADTMCSSARALLADALDRHDRRPTGRA
ncbi:hypothetical protein [Nonomuraea sp. NPDC049684]|uniref:hypothetical protein n=1 Tax=Nonomuraea sp. NPDC049684 TaxID=3364356 RepID=UPI00378A565D